MNFSAAVIFEEMKNINNHHQKLENKAKQNTQLPPKAEITRSGEMVSGCTQAPGRCRVGRGFTPLQGAAPTVREEPGVRSDCGDSRGRGRC